MRCRQWDLQLLADTAVQNQQRGLFHHRLHLTLRRRRLANLHRQQRDDFRLGSSPRLFPMLRAQTRGAPRSYSRDCVLRVERVFGLLELRAPGSLCRPMS